MADSHRIAWLDWAKVIGMFLVVLGHCYPFASPPCYVRNLIYSFHMPLFFFMSGMLFKQRTVAEAARKSFVALIVPLLSWNAVWILIFGGGVIPQLRNVFYGETIICGPSWFFFSLFECQMLAAMLVNRRTRFCGVALSLLLLLLCKRVPYCYVGSAAMSLPFFLAGFALRATLCRCNGVRVAGLAVVGSVVLLVSAGVFGPASVRNVAFGNFWRTPLPKGFNIPFFYFIAMCGIISFLLLLKMLHGIIWKWLENVGMCGKHIANNLDRYAAWCSSGMVVFLCAHRLPHSWLDPYLWHVLSSNTLAGLGIRIVVSVALMLFCSLIYWAILRSVHLGCLTGFRHGR